MGQRERQIEKERDREKQKDWEKKRQTERDTERGQRQTERQKERNREFFLKYRAEMKEKYFPFLIHLPYSHSIIYLLCTVPAQLEGKP